MKTFLMNVKGQPERVETELGEMGTPRENAKAVSDLISQIKAHPMCLTFEFTGSHYRVLYPCGMVFDGAQVAVSNRSKSAAFGGNGASLETKRSQQ